MSIRIERLSLENFSDYEKLTCRQSHGFHVGVLAYQDDKLLAWISVGPLTDFYWTWRRVAQVGDDSKVVGFERAGFSRIGAHWLNNPEAERSIYRFSLN